MQNSAPNKNNNKYLFALSKEGMEINPEILFEYFFFLIFIYSNIQFIENLIQTQYNFRKSVNIYVLGFNKYHHQIYVICIFEKVG